MSITKPRAGIKTTKVALGLQGQGDLVFDELINIHATLSMYEHPDDSGWLLGEDLSRFMCPFTR